MGKWHEILPKWLEGALRGTRGLGGFEGSGGVRGMRDAAFPTSLHPIADPLVLEPGTRVSTNGGRDPLPELF